MIVTLLIFVGSILVLVGIHEAGHFLAAKASGVYVIEYAIGFGPKIVSFRGRETRYSIRLIPFGGYVRMAGEDRRDIPEDVPPDRVLYAKPPWVRSLISFAGPASNLLLTFLISTVVVLSIGFPILQVAELIDGQPAEEVLRPGDRVLRVDGTPILLVDDLTDAIQRSDGEEIALRIRRDGEEQTVRIDPVYDEEADRYVVGAYFQGIAYTAEIVDGATSSPLASFGLFSGDRILSVDGEETETGVAVLLELARATAPVVLRVERTTKERIEIPVDDPESLYETLSSDPPFGDLGVERRHVGLSQGIVLGARQFATYVTLLGEVVGGIVRGDVAARDALQGPVGVAQTLGEGFRLGPAVFFQLLAFLSLNFGLLNLVPFPGLDGSRIAFSLYESVRGRPIPVEREGLIHAIGFLVLIGLMILITYKDLVSLFR